MDADLCLNAESLTRLLPVELGPMFARWSVLGVMWLVLGVMERKMNEMDIKNSVRGCYMRPE